MKNLIDLSFWDNPRTETGWVIPKKESKSIFDRPITFKREISEEIIELLISASTKEYDGKLLYSHGNLPEALAPTPEVMPVIGGRTADTYEPTMIMYINDEFAISMYNLEEGWISSSRDPVDPPTLVLPSNPWYTIDESLLAQLFEI